MDQVITDLIITGQGYQRREREELSSVSRFAVSPSAAQERGHPTNIINAAMKYYDKTQFGRDRTPGDPQQFHNVNSLVWRCGAAGVRALPVLTAHDISLPEQ